MKKEEKINPTLDPYKTEPFVETQMFRGNQIYKAQQVSITDATGGGTIDTEARTALNSILSVLRNITIIKR